MAKVERARETGHPCRCEPRAKVAIKCTARDAAPRPPSLADHLWIVIVNQHIFSLTIVAPSAM